MNASAITCRPALSGDLNWLWELKRATMRDYVEAIFGWDDEAQRKMFEAGFDPARIRVIQVDGQDAGLLELDDQETHFFLSRIEILPALQRKGIGSAVIMAILDEARRRNKGVLLQVLRSNPARALYERLGFVVVRETSTHCHMQKDPAQSTGPARGSVTDWANPAPARVPRVVHL